METATEYNTEIEVHAEKASPLKRYRCKCGREVTLIQRGQVRPHFKHLYDSKAVDCERYQVGYSGLGGWNIFTEKKTKIKLYASIEITGSSQIWRLDLHLSRGFLQDYAGDQVEVLAAYPRPMRIPLVSNMNDLSVKVFPSDKDYRVLIGEDVITIPGLNREEINVFQCTDGFGRQLDYLQSLVVGETYLLVFKSDYFPIPPTGCSFFTLPSCQGWNAGILSIPINPDISVRTWCRNVLMRSIILPGLSMRVLSPIENERNIDGSVVVPSNTPIFVGVYGPHGQYVSPLLGIKQITQDTVPKWIELNGELPLVFRVGELSPGDYGFILKEEHECSLLLKVENKARIFEPPGINFVIEDNNGELSRNVPLISRELLEHFKLVQKKEKILKSCQIPYGATLKIEINITSNKGVEKYQRTYKNKCNEMYEDRMLYTQATSIIIDGGNFGSVYVSNPTNSSKKTIAHLDSNLRSKISWLVQAARKQKSAKRLVYKSMGQEFLVNLVVNNRADYELVREFLEIEFWPNSLYNQVLSVSKAIKR